MKKKCRVYKSKFPDGGGVTDVYENGPEWDNYLKQKSAMDNYNKYGNIYKELENSGQYGTFSNVKSGFAGMTPANNSSGFRSYNYDPSQVDPYSIEGVGNLGDQAGTEGFSDTRGRFLIPDVQKPTNLIDYNIVDSPDEMDRKAREQYLIDNNIIGYKKVANKNPIAGQPDYENIPLKKGSDIPTDGSFVRSEQVKNVIPSFKKGGSNKGITQDSKNDPVYEEKTNKFVNWLQQTSTEFKEKEMLKAQQLMQQQSMQRPFMQAGGNFGRNPTRNSGYGNDMESRLNQYNIEPPQYPADPNEMYNAMGDIRYPTGPISAKNTSGFNFPTENYQQINKPSENIVQPPQSIQDLIGFDYEGLNDGMDNIPLGSETMGNINMEQPLNWNVPMLDDPTAPDAIDYNDPKGPFVNTDNIEGYENRYTGEEFAKPGDNNPGRPNEKGMPYIPWGDIARTEMDIASFIGNRDERASEQRRVDERMSNVHRFNPTNKRSNRGDYLVNTKREGEYFRPNTHTRFGYGNTAQNGMEVNSEQDLSESEIANLLAQGYQLEYLD